MGRLDRDEPTIAPLPVLPPLPDQDLLGTDEEDDFAVVGEDVGLDDAPFEDADEALVDDVIGSWLSEESGFEDARDADGPREPEGGYLDETPADIDAGLDFGDVDGVSDDGGLEGLDETPTVVSGDDSVDLPPLPPESANEDELGID